MSSLSDLQPTIFFASCTLKGLIWIPFAFLPELLFLTKEDEDDGTSIFHDHDEQEEALLQDHHIVFLERICHYTNIFFLLGLISFYAINPRLWRYRNYGWLWTLLLMLQHVPQQLQHEGFLFLPTFFIKDTNDEYGSLIMQQVLEANRIFTTIGVVVFQLYALYYGHYSTLKRFAAEPLFVFGAIVTLLLETHLTCLFVWVYHTSHPSTVLSYHKRITICSSLILGLIGVGIWHRQVHPQQYKLLRKQFKTIHNKGQEVKMKFV